MIKTRAERARENRDAATVPAINDALAAHDTAVFCRLLYEEVKRQGVATVARRAGMNRRKLHATLTSNQNPTLVSLLSILDALGFEFRIK